MTEKLLPLLSEALEPPDSLDKIQALAQQDDEVAERLFTHGWPANPPDEPPPSQSG